MPSLCTPHEAQRHKACWVSLSPSVQGCESAYCHQACHALTCSARTYLVMTFLLLFYITINNKIIVVI